MTTNNEHVQLVTSLIRKDFGITQDELTNYDHLESLRDRLEQIISYLLDKEFDRLLQAMYRIDIGEEQFKAALAIDPPSEVAATITQLIIDRERQKAITRAKYSK